MLVLALVCHRLRRLWSLVRWALFRVPVTSGSTDTGTGSAAAGSGCRDDGCCRLDPTLFGWCPIIIPTGATSIIIAATGDKALNSEKRDPDSITQLALDLRWTWNHSTDELWRELEPELWEATRNPWVILQSVSRDRLQRLLSEKRFRERVDSILAKLQAKEASAAWFQKAHPDSG
jgi:hypothetical protein